VLLCCCQLLLGAASLSKTDCNDSLQQQQ
jgi:hypothetical protein